MRGKLVPPLAALVVTQVASPSSLIQWTVHQPLVVPVIHTFDSVASISTMTITLADQSPGVAIHPLLRYLHCARREERHGVRMLQTMRSRCLQTECLHFLALYLAEDAAV